MRLVLAVHGTASPAGQQVYRDLTDRVGAHVPTALAHLDVQTPLLADVARAGDVVVPVLLARGYHVRVDCTSAAALGAVVAPPVGPAQEVVALAQRRLREAGAGDDWAVVLATAGSRDPTAQRDLQLAARRLQRLRGTEVELAFASRPGEVAAAVAALRQRSGARVAVASWLLAPGRFASAAAAAGGDTTAAPLGADEALVAVVLQRWASARGALAA
ncbi:MAG: sirohydrochlorin chelatase [Actinomycetes bacterium]